MRANIVHPRAMATAFVLIAALVSLNAKAETETVDGLVVRIGLDTAGHAGKSPEAHVAPLRIPKSQSMQRLVVSLSYAGNHERITDARVDVEVKNPPGQVQKKALLHAVATAPADYSDFFRFDQSGQYLITVFVLRKGETDPTEAVFAENVP
jgi:hypothetical protein